MNFPKLLFLLLSIYTIFCVSCKKDEDTSPPIITELAPNENTSFNTFDSISVQANLYDERELTFVSVELLNADLISVVTPYGKNLNGTDHFLNAQLIVDNIHIISGLHYILITAKDQQNTTRTYIKVHVNGIPFETKGYVSFESLGSGSEVHSYYGQSDTLLLQTESEIIDGIVDSYYQQFGILKGPDGPFESHPLYPFIDGWDIESIHGGINYCRSQSDDLSIQIGFMDQLLSFYEGEASLKASFNSESNYSPYYSLKNGENIIVWQKAPGQSSNRLEVFYPSGAIKQVTQYNHTIVGLEQKNNTSIFVIANENTSAYFDIYNLETGVIESQVFEDLIYYDSCLDPAGNLYISSSNGILKYSSTSFQFSTFSALIASQITWDEDQGVLVAAVGSQLKTLGPFGVELNSVALNGECVELSVWYSK